ncbi:Aldehyde dehydrogenase family 3 member F1 [Citrus sinensis]|nr:Aldehyde dehydrogenase family 3 member F1 [Citrus sinensis]
MDVKQKGLSLEPLIGAIAAGNTVVLKPSELASASSSLLANALPTYIDSKAIKVIEGGPAVGEHLLQQKWDKIFFTGSTRVGRMVMSAAVKHLTPITLELGGKCPAIIDSLTSSWDKELKRIEDSIDFINSRPKPLVIYAFTKNERLQRRMVSETSSGSIVFNDAVIQFVADTLPFGGIGESGIGSYHGKFSFDAFSHHKPVVRRSYLSEIWFRFPPWNNYKLQLFELVYNYDYLGMLLVILGLKRPRKVAI